MKSICALVDEHRLIEQVLNCLEKMAEESSRRKELDTDLAGEAVAFFRTFVHGWHFPREEAYLSRATDPDSPGQTEDLQFHDHQRCGGHLREMEHAVAASASGDRGAVDRFVEHAHAYISVLMNHNEDEEDRVFPAVERMLTDEGEWEAVRALRHAELPLAGRPELDACIDGAHRLADRFNVPRAALSNAAP